MQRYQCCATGHAYVRRWRRIQFEQCGEPVQPFLGRVEVADPCQFDALVAIAPRDRIGGELEVR